MSPCGGDTLLRLAAHYLEHIVDVRLDKPCPDFLSPLRKGSYHLGLYLARLGLNIVVIDLWHGEL